MNSCSFLPFPEDATQFGTANNTQAKSDDADIDC
jgi:hypothetical protein